MTMLSAQPITLTGEQHDRLWKQAKLTRERAAKLADYVDEHNDRNDDDLRMIANSVLFLFRVADEIEATLVSAVDSAPATASSGEAA